MRKYQYFLMITLMATGLAYALAISKGVSQEMATLIAGYVAILSMFTFTHQVGGMSALSAIVIANFSFLSVLAFSAVGMWHSHLTGLAGIYNCQPASLTFLTGFIIAGGTVIGVSEKLHLKRRWILAMNLTTFIALVVALSTTNLMYVGFCVVCGALLIQQAGDITKSELEVAKVPQQKQQAG